MMGCKERRNYTNIVISTRKKYGIGMAYLKGMPYLMG